MVEVFKTNVYSQMEAIKVIEKIHENFSNYIANFDLEDCDKILRVKCTTGSVQPYMLIRLLNDQGFVAEILPDNVPLLQSAKII